MNRDPLNVVALAYDGLCTFEFGVAVELFGLARPEFDPWYRFRVASAQPGTLRAVGGFTLEAPYSLRILDRAGTIIVPGWREIDKPIPEAIRRKLRTAYQDGARILSVCSGAFVLAGAGLLDGKRATTHWKYAGKLASRYPNIQVDPDVLFVDEGQVLTSAGSAAGIDMGLHLIRRDFGAGAANSVARQLVVPPHRDGGQKQFIDTPVESDPEERALSQLLDRVRGNLGSTHTVTNMAARARMSKRTFARRFKQATGTTPHRWLQHERVRLVQDLLESSKLSLEGIASRAGFADAQILRLHFRRVVGTTPSAYRRTFQANASKASSR